MAEPSLNQDTAEPASSSDTANAPPSVADSYVQPLPREFPPDYDFATCTHRHWILAMVPQDPSSGSSNSEADAEADAEAADDTTAVPVALCHWHPPSVSHVEIPPAELPPRLFSVIRDAQPLGTFCVPEDLDVAAALSGRLADLPVAVEEESRLEGGLELELTAQRLGGLMGGLEVSEGREGGRWLRFFGFPVYSDCAERVLGKKGLCPVWKWAKPESIYRKVGLWKMSLHEALDDGEWNGGRNLFVLTRGMSEERLKAMGLREDDEPSRPGSPLDLEDRGN